MVYWALIVAAPDERPAPAMELRIPGAPGFLAAGRMP